jgi:hypothetical protein
MPVRKNPGSMEITRIPNGSSSTARPSLRTLTACLLAMYDQWMGAPATRPATDDTLTTTPERRDLMDGSTARSSRSGP